MHIYNFFVHIYIYIYMLRNCKNNEKKKTVAIPRLGKRDGESNICTKEQRPLLCPLLYEI